MLSFCGTSMKRTADSITLTAMPFKWDLLLASDRDGDGDVVGVLRLRRCPIVDVDGVGDAIYCDPKSVRIDESSRVEF